MGDPAGISPELLVKLLSVQELLDLAAVTVIGDQRVLALGEKAAGVSLDIETVSTADKAAARPGKPIFVDLKHLDPATIPMREATAEGGKFAMRNFCEALQAAKARRHDGIMLRRLTSLRSSAPAIRIRTKSAGPPTYSAGTARAANTISSIICGTRASPRTSRCAMSPTC
jgi:hypothetical protein